jgi:hypothetical protein
VRIRNEKDAIAAYVAARWGSIPEGYHVKVTSVELAYFGGYFGDGDESCLWRVKMVPDDESDILKYFPGAITTLGPDGKVWEISGNNDWHDRDIWEKALAHLYIEGVADLVDSESLAHHVELITASRDSAILALPDAARRGELRRAPAEG